ncbi:MAG: hypothetical protein RIS35_871, partial [Pseudomonadota bacterium]
MLDLNDVHPLGNEPPRYDIDLVVARLRE